MLSREAVDADADEREFNVGPAGECRQDVPPGELFPEDVLFPVLRNEIWLVPQALQFAYGTLQMIGRDRPETDGGPVRVVADRTAVQLREDDSVARQVIADIATRDRVLLLAGGIE